MTPKSSIAQPGRIMQPSFATTLRTESATPMTKTFSLNGILGQQTSEFKGGNLTEINQRKYPEQRAQNLASSRSLFGKNRKNMLSGRVAEDNTNIT